VTKPYLVIVESPGQIKKLKASWVPITKIVASLGHVMDLPPKAFGINLEQMEAEYVVHESRRCQTPAQ